MTVKSRAASAGLLKWTPNTAAAMEGLNKVHVSSTSRSPKHGLTAVAKAPCPGISPVRRLSPQAPRTHGAKMNGTSRPGVSSVDDNRLASPAAKSNFSQSDATKRVSSTSGGVTRMTVTVESNMTAAEARRMTASEQSPIAPSDTAKPCASRVKVSSAGDCRMTLTSRCPVSRLREAPPAVALRALRADCTDSANAARITAPPHASLNSSGSTTRTAKVIMKSDLDTYSDRTDPNPKVFSSSTCLVQRSGRNKSAGGFFSCQPVSKVEVHSCSAALSESDDALSSFGDLSCDYRATVHDRRKLPSAHQSSRERCVIDDGQPRTAAGEHRLKGTGRCTQSSAGANVISAASKTPGSRAEPSDCVPHLQQGHSKWTTARQRVGFVTHQLQCQNSTRTLSVTSSAAPAGTLRVPQQPSHCKPPSVKKSVTFSPSHDIVTSFEDEDSDVEQPSVCGRPVSDRVVTGRSSISLRHSGTRVRRPCRRSVSVPSDPAPCDAVSGASSPALASRARHPASSAFSTSGPTCVVQALVSDDDPHCLDPHTASAAVTRHAGNVAALSPDDDDDDHVFSPAPNPPVSSAAAVSNRAVNFAAVHGYSSPGSVPATSPAGSGSIPTHAVASPILRHAHGGDAATVTAPPSSASGSSTPSLIPAREEAALHAHGSSQRVRHASAPSPSSPAPTKWKDMAEVMRRIRQDAGRGWQADSTVHWGDPSTDRLVRIVLNNVCYQLPLKPHLPQRQEHLFDVSDLQHEPPLISKCGSLEVTFNYQPVRGRMTVHVLRARELPTKDRGGASSTQVRMMLLPTKKQRFKTKVKEGEEPVFDETFVFNKIFADEVPGLGVRFRLYGLERMRREYMIGESVVGFASLNLDEASTHWVILEPRSNLSGDSGFDVCSLSRSDSASSVQSLQHGGMPELLLGLAYHGTTGRLAVQVIKGSNFRNMATNRPPDTYVKVTLMSASGQELQSCKTSIRRGQPNPLFRETFMLQVAQFLLPQVTLMVSVYNKKSMKKKEMIGWFSLGQNSSGEEEGCHWADMTDSKGDEVCRWHVLLES